MKKLFSLLLALALLLSLFACSDEPPAPNDGGDTAPAPQANPATDFEYTVMRQPDCIGITKYVGTSTSIVFPETIDGLPVTIIGGGLLSGSDVRYAIESVVIPDTVETIVDGAFSNCKSLVSVDFGAGVRSIGESAFENCTALQKIILPPKLETIGADAFYNCSSATEIFVPKTVKAWGRDYSRGTFGGCAALTTLTFEDGLEQIGYWATFSGAESLESIEIPASVKKIAPLCFNACPSLKTVVFHGDAPEATLASGSNVQYVFDYTNANEDLVIYYDPATNGWDTIAWREVHRLEWMK